MFDRPLSLRPAVFAGFVLGALGGALPCLADTPPPFLLEFGSFGSGDGQFYSAGSVAVGPDGRLYVADVGNRRIEIFTTDGVYLGQWGSGQLSVRAFAINSLGEVYVVDQGNSRVQKFTGDGTLLTQWGGWGSENGQFRWPAAVAVGPDGSVYVADSNNHRIQQFDADGVYIRQWGHGGYDPGEFNLPAGLAVDQLGAVYVSEAFGYRIQKFTADGTYILGWGSQGSDEGEFYTPGGMAVDASGALYVAETIPPGTNVSNHRVQKFSSDGNFLTMWGGPGNAPGQFNAPYFVAVDPTGNVFVADTYNNRVQKFAGSVSGVPPKEAIAMSISARPNPFFATATIQYRVEAGAAATVEILNVMGQRVRRLLEGSTLSGEASVEWNGRRDDGALAPSGKYFVVLASGGNRRVEGLVLAR